MGGTYDGFLTQVEVSLDQVVDTLHVGLRLPHTLYAHL